MTKSINISFFPHYPLLVDFFDITKAQHVPSASLEHGHFPLPTYSQVFAVIALLW